MLHDTVQQIFEHHSRPIWRSREPTQRRMATRCGFLPSEGQRMPLPVEIICSTCVVVTTSGKVPKPHSGLFTESKCVKPVHRIAAPASTVDPSESRAVKSPGPPENSSMRQPLRTSTSGLPSTRLTIPPIAPPPPAPARGGGGGGGAGRGGAGGKVTPRAPAPPGRFAPPLLGEEGKSV